MPFVDTNGLKVVERLPGRKGRYFHSASMTFAHYEFAAGPSIHEHFHPEEEVYEVIEGELEVIIDGRSQVVMSGGWPEACALMTMHVFVWAICATLLPSLATTKHPRKAQPPDRPLSIL